MRGAVIILANQRNVFALTNNLKSQGAQRSQCLGFGSINRKLWHGGLYHGLGDESIQCRVFGFQRFPSEGFDVKSNSALDIMQSFIESLALAHDDSPNASRIGHITFGMLFNDDLHEREDMPV